MPLFDRRQDDDAPLTLVGIQFADEGERGVVVLVAVEQGHAVSLPPSRAERRHVAT